MDGVLNWVKGIVTLLVVGNVLLYLVQGRTYEKYISFFLQLLVVLAVLSPIAKVAGSEEEFLSYVENTHFLQELDNMKKDYSRVPSDDTNYCKTQYEKVVADDVKRVIEQENYMPSYVLVELSDAYEIESIQIGICITEQKDESMAEEAGQIVIEKIQMNSGEKKQDEGVNYKYGQLLSVLSSYYQLEQNQIIIEEVTA